MMSAFARLFAILSCAALGVAALCQAVSPHVEAAQRLVSEKMEADWGSEVTATWGAAQLLQFTGEVNVAGYGRVQRLSDKVGGVFVFDVTMYTIRRLAPKVSYTMLRWDSEGTVDDKYMIRASQILVRQRLETELRTRLRMDFTEPTLSNVSTEIRAVVGAGTFSTPGSHLSGAFKYTVHFSRTNGAIERLEVAGIPSNPGWGSGGSHNAYTEGIAQSHASEYVRQREGSSVQVQFTGPVNHMTVAKGVDRVTGRGQWRRGSSFQWADFRYDIQVSIDEGRVLSAVVNLTPDTHANPNDQRFITFAQDAVRRDFRPRSPAQITFLSARAEILPLGKRAVRGEFSAGGKRYSYEVIQDASNGRSERVTIGPAR